MASAEGREFPNMERSYVSLIEYIYVATLYLYVCGCFVHDHESYADASIELLQHRLQLRIRQVHNENVPSAGAYVAL